jgi:hypothetical protein
MSTDTYNGVIELSTGDLLRCGYYDFTNNVVTEALRTDVPFPGKRRGALDETQMHRWDGAAWTLVAQPTTITSTKYILHVIKEETTGGGIKRTETPIEVELVGENAVLKTQIFGPADDARQFFSKGNGDNIYTAVPNATNNFDMLITAGDVGADSLTQLTGGEYWTDGNVQSGDYVEFSVVDKDNVLGLFTTYGLTVGVDVLEVGKYVKKRPIRANDHDKIQPNQATALMQGLYLRTVYIAVNSGVDRKILVSFDLAK